MRTLVIVALLNLSLVVTPAMACDSYQDCVDKAIALADHFNLDYRPPNGGPCPADTFREYIKKAVIFKRVEDEIKNRDLT